MFECSDDLNEIRGTLKKIVWENEGTFDGSFVAGRFRDGSA